MTIDFLCWKILRKYGIPKPKFDKNKYNKAGKEQHPVKVVSTKRPVTKPPTKEKSMLNSVRWVSSALWNIGFHRRNPGFYPPSLCASVCWNRESDCGVVVRTAQISGNSLAKCFFFQRLGWSCWDLFVEHWNCVQQCSIPVHLFQNTHQVGQGLERPMEGVPWQGVGLDEL